jgi:hypothetical protein
MTNPDDCVKHAGFWFDAKDVDQTTDAGFAALKPTCHVKRDDECPTSGMINIAKGYNNSMQASSVTATSVTNYNFIGQVYSTIRCLKGANLSLNFSNGNLEEFDASVNPDITYLTLDRNSDLAKIRLPKDTSKLVQLSIVGSKVPVTTFQGIASLTGLYVRSMAITKLDVSKMPELRWLDVAHTNLTALDLSHNDHLLGIDIGYTGIPVASLNLMRYSLFLSFGAANMGLTSLADVPTASLVELTLDDNAFPNMDLSGMPDLVFFSCDSCQMNTLDVSQNTDLIQLAVSHNGLSSLDVTGMPDLQYLLAQNNALASLDLTQNAALEYLDVDANSLTSLDLAANDELYNLSASDNALTAIDLSTNVLLTSVDVSDNDLTSLDLSTDVLLTDVDVSGNDLTSLGLSTNALLTYVDVSDNDLTYDGSATKWDLHTLTALQTLKVRGNPNLVLDFEDGVTFASEFLDSTQASIWVEKDAWDTYVGANKPVWDYVGADPNGYYQFP